MLKRITGLQMVQLGIPRASLRPPFEVNTDTAHIDARCLKRYRRRYSKPYWLIPGYSRLSTIPSWSTPEVRALIAEALNA